MPRCHSSEHTAASGGPWCAGSEPDTAALRPPAGCWLGGCEACAAVRMSMSSATESCRGPGLGCWTSARRRDSSEASPARERALKKFGPEGMAPSCGLRWKGARACFFVSNSRKAQDLQVYAVLSASGIRCTECPIVQQFVLTATLSAGWVVLISSSHGQRVRFRAATRSCDVQANEHRSNATDA